MPWDPVRDLRAWQERFERMTTHHADSWRPPIDVYETDDRYVVSAELPGLARDEIELALEDARLTIKGERHDRAGGAAEAVHFHQVERGHGAFLRTFDFGVAIDATAVTADLDKGVLTITLPKRAAPAARRIEVR